MIPFVNLANPGATEPGTGLTADQEAQLATATRRQPVANIAALKALTPSAGDAVSVLGYYAAGDGGGGTFYYDGASSATDNGGTIIAPTVGSGRWLRAYSGPINVRWFGARMDAGSRTASISASSTTLTVSTSGLRVGAAVFVPGAGAAGANLRAVITAIGSGQVTLGTAAGTTVSGVTIYHGTPDHAAINAAIAVAAGGVGEVVFPYGSALIEEPVNMTLQPNGVVIRGLARYRSAILANTGGAAIDMCGSSACRLEGMRVYTVSQLNNPSTVGVALMRAASRTIAAYCEFRRLIVEIATAPSANGGVGTIAFYNYGGEFNVHDTVVYKADLPVVIANSNLYSVASYWTTEISSGTAMTQTEFVGGNELSARGGGNCMVISNAANVNVNSYFAKVTDESTEAAIKIVGTLKTGEFNINVEHYGKILDVQGQTSRLRIHGNVDYLINGVPWYDIKAECRHCVFGMFPGGTADDGTGEPLFAVTGGGKLSACEAHVMLGRGTGLSEANGRGVRVISELMGILRVRMNTATAYPSLTSGQTTVIVWDQEDWEAVSSLYSTSTGRFTAPVSGLYRVSARYQVQLAAAAPNAQLLVTVDGSTQLRRQGRVEAGISVLQISGVVWCAAGSYIDVRVNQDSGQASVTTGDFDGDASDLVIELL